MIPHRPVLAAVILLLYCSLVSGQDKEKTGPTGLHDFLLAKAREHFDARRKAVAALKTPEDVRRRQEELRRHFLAALGDLPAKTPLNARVIGRKQCEGYSFERVVYESRPNHHVTAVFYLPE